MSAGHLAAQRAVVRMLFDPVFAAAVRRDPAGTLPTVPAVLREQLAAVDPRAIDFDTQRRLRTLGQLTIELKATTAIALDETRSYAFAEAFFSSSEFHGAIEERGALVFAFAAYLAAALASGRLTAPLLPDVLAIETASARARRATTGSVPVPPSPRAGTLLVRRAAGVTPLAVDSAALGALQTVERHLFALSLLPSLALCADAPRLRLPDRSGRVQALVVVPAGGGVSLVDVDHDLRRVLAAADAPRTIDRLVPEAAARGVDLVRARALVDQLLDDEILEAVHAR